MTLASDAPGQAGDAKAAERARIRAARRERAARSPDAGLPRSPIEPGPLLAILGPESGPRHDDGSRTVACYLAMPGEPDTTAIIAGLQEAGIRVIVPAIAGNTLTWHRLDSDTPTSIATNGPAIRVACSPALDEDVLAECTAVVVPALMVDRHGHRLGQGGGYYDRALARLRRSDADLRPLLIAVVFEEELVDALAPGLTLEHDVDVDAVLTESGLTRCAGPRRRSPLA